MAEQHDMFDDIIEISKGVDALKNPFGGITDALLGTVDESKPHWNPADYKERPRVNCIPCLACKSEKSSCHACMETAFRAWPANPRRAAAMRAWTYAR